MPLYPPSASGILPVGTAQLIAAGDMGGQGGHAADTAALINTRPAATVLSLGDTAYAEASAANIASYYEPYWGNFKARTHFVVGNHDWFVGGTLGGTRVAAPNLWDYAGASAGDPLLGYYDYPINQYWHCIVLNDELNYASTPTGFAGGSTQEAWLRAKLIALIGKRVVVAWHRPRWSSGSSHGSSVDTHPFWKACADFGAAMVLSGHDHGYERIAALNGVGNIPASGGTVQFVSGAGGQALDDFLVTPLTTSAARYNATYGILVLTLTATGYAWQFVDKDGTMREGGTATCAALAYPALYDTFTGANGNVSGHVADNGGTATVSAGTATITSNRFTATSVSTYAQYTTVLADVNVSAQINLGTDDVVAREMGVIVRWVDSNNFWRAVLTRSAVGVSTVALIKRAAGVDTNAFTPVTVTTALNTTYDLTATATGSAWAVYLDGVLKGTATDAFQSTAVKHGLVTRTGVAAGAYQDNLSVVAS